MSSREWRIVYQTIRRIDRKIERPRRRPEYSDVLVVAMYLWAVGHDRPQSWACRRDSYDGRFRPRALPSQSRFNRRIRSPRCQAILKRLPEFTRPPNLPGMLHHLDSRPLPVGPCSKDSEAKPGRVYAGFARGYRLHACTREDAYFADFQVTAMNVSEKPIALELLDRVRPDGWILADGNFDSSALYERAARAGGQLLAPPRKGEGRGHRKPNPHRVHAVRLWPLMGVWALRERKSIDRFFGQHSTYGGGLAPLPAWVRTLDRVSSWITAKIALYHVRVSIRKQVA
jgi:hypothetical protein